MTEQKLSENTDRDSVEQQWIALLTDRGLSEAQADETVSSLEAHPRLRRTNPGPEEVRKYLGAAIRDHPFEDYEQVDRPDQLRGELIETLDEGVDGARPGPIPLPNEQTPYRPAGSGAVPVDEDAFDSMTPGSEPVPAFAFESGGASAEDIDQLKRELQQLEAETDLGLEDVAEFIDESYDEGYDKIINLLINADVHVNVLEVALEELGVQTNDTQSSQ